MTSGILLPPPPAPPEENSVKKVAIKNLLCTENQLPQGDEWSSLKRKSVEELYVPQKRQKTSPEKPYSPVINVETDSSTASAQEERTHKKRKPKQYWTEVEDEALKKAVEECKDGISWVEIAEKVRLIRPGVTRDSCCKRYELMLDPRINRDPWTDEEYKNLHELAKAYELKKTPWKKIAKQLGTNRTNQMCREIFRSLTRGTLKPELERILKLPNPSDQL